MHKYTIILANPEISGKQIA